MRGDDPKLWYTVVLDNVIGWVLDYDMDVDQNLTLKVKIDKQYEHVEDYAAIYVGAKSASNEYRNFDVNTISSYYILQTIATELSNDNSETSQPTEHKTDASVG